MSVPPKECFDYGVFDGSASNAAECLPKWNAYANACGLNFTDECEKTFGQLNSTFEQQGMTKPRLLRRAPRTMAMPVPPADECYDYGVFDGSAANANECLPQWNAFSGACYANWTADCQPAFDRLNAAIASWTGGNILALRKAKSLAKRRAPRTMEIVPPKDPECYNEGLFQDWTDPDECSLAWFAFWDACEAEGKFWDEVCQGPNQKLEDYFANNPIQMIHALTKRAKFMRHAELT